MNKQITNFNLLIFSLLLFGVLFTSSSCVAQQSVVTAQKSQIDSLIEAKRKTDSALAKELENFKSQGIEKELNTGNLSADSLINYAKTYIGTPHCMGGTSHKCIDCSGLLYVTFKHFGVNVPHNSDAMAHYGKVIVNQKDLKPGDLVFFIRTYKTSKFITHSGIYIGNGDFIHTSARRGVMISNLNSKYYQEHYIFGTRVLNKN